MPDTPMITENQWGYIQDLLISRDAPEVSAWFASNDHEKLTRVQASRCIDKLKNAPLMPLAKPSPEAMLPNGVNYTEDGLPYVLHDGVTIPRGSYGVITPDRKNEISFFSLWIAPTDHRLRGKMSMKQMVGPEEYRISPGDRAGIIALIAEQTPVKCAERFGLEIGECGICGRRLTNDESRKRGIGPICAGRWGW